MAVVRRPSNSGSSAAGWWRIVAAAVVGVILTLLTLSSKGPQLVQGVAGGSNVTGAIMTRPPCQEATDAKQQGRRPGVGRLPPGTMPMELPSRAAFDKLEADPALAERDPSLAAEFEAAPWLLPPRTQALSYAGVHDLEKLLELRSKPAGRWPKTVTLLTFNKRFAIMAQNGIYSMVKFGGVRNYVVVTWDPEDLAACAELNLPCADVTAFLPEPMDKGPNAGQYGTHDYLVVCWLRPALLVRLLELGYATLSTDSDIVFMVKPLWDSYLAFMEDGGSADAGFQSEGPINGGNYLMVPTPAALSLARGWSSLGADMIKAGQHDQQAFHQIDRTRWELCQPREHCRVVREQINSANATDTKALIRTFLPNFYSYWDDPCALGAGDKLPKFDPCDWSLMLLHPVCVGYEGKLALFKYQGFWFVDDENCKPRNNSATQVAACHPRQWRDPTTELPLYSCPEYGLAFQHERRTRQPPPEAQGAQPVNDTGQAVTAKQAR